jgi:CIC family chloride channel protein
VRRALPEEATLFGTALAVGIGAGVAAVVFRYLIAAVQWVAYDWLPILFAGNYGYVVVAPTVGGLLVGLLIYFFAREAKGHGVPEVMAAVALHGGRIRPIVAAVKALASAICIGSGGSVGREGPIVQIGSALGSTLAQWWKLSEERTQSLVACGAAAGIAATFNAPIAGVIFALEVILGGRFGVRYFSTVVVAAVAASVVGRVAFGDAPAFQIPFEYGVQSLWEFAFYPLLGVAAALVGAAYTRSIYGAEDAFDAWTSVPEWVKPAVGGLLLGGLALAYPLFTPATWDRVPQVYNVGYEIIEQALASELSLAVLLTLLVLKIIATTLTLGSGGSGGVFAPGLFIGAMLGAAFHAVLSLFVPDLLAPGGAYALVGMAAVFAASAHAPITAVIMLFELTGDYRIVLPLMLTTVVATLLAQRLLRGESIYTLKLSRRGVRLQQGRDVDLMDSVSVSDVMSRDISSVAADSPLCELGAQFERRRRTGLVVADSEGHLAGFVTISDLERANEADLPGDTPIEAIATGRDALVVAESGESIGDALARMGARGLRRLPVVATDDPRRVVGIVHRNDIVRAYQLALARRTGDRLRSGARRSPQADFVSLVLDPRDPVVGMTIREMASRLPADAVIVAVERDDQIIIPHGDTRLCAGDHVTGYARRDAANDLIRALQD